MYGDSDVIKLAEEIRHCAVKRLYERMAERGVYRAYIIYSKGEFTLSHPDLLAPLEEFFKRSPAFAQHEGVFIGREYNLDTLFFAFVHDTRRGLAQGGLRFCNYSTLAELLEDGLRRSREITRKNAMARLWWGGGNGIMALPFDIHNQSGIARFERRKKYFEAYGRFVASLRGLYYTSEDVGTSAADIEAVRMHNRFTNCATAAIGDSANSSPYTAQAVLRALQAAWRFLNEGSLKGVKVAVQGAGDVGTALVAALDNLGAEVWVADSANTDQLKLLKKIHPGLHIVERDHDVYDLDADILSPCADGAVINSDTIPRLKVKLICGSANNILGSPDDVRRLQERAIALVPDYLCTCAEAISRADEWMGYLPEDIFQNAIEKVYSDTLKIFAYAKHNGITTTEAAEQIADAEASQLHPLMKHRGEKIIRHLVDNYWEEAPTPAQYAVAVGDYEAALRHGPMAAYA